MHLLALDTSTEACSAALGVCLPGEPERVLTRAAEAPRGHAELILPMVESLLAEAGLSLSSLGAIAFARGPGSFTGLRLAAAVTQGLAFGAGLPVLAVSTLRASALQALQRAPSATHVLVCNDARMGEVYVAAFARGAGGLPEPLGPESVCPPSSVVMPATSGVWVGAGHGFRAYPQLEQAAPASSRPGEARPGFTEIFADLLPQAREVLPLARAEWAAGRILKPAEAQPVYLRDDVAKVPQA
jgi:tRNA threonylcarbamoyladenosine biosynthesis protein TsaB